MKFNKLVDFLAEDIVDQGQLSSGFLKSKKAVDMVRQAALGKHLLKTGKGKMYRVIGPLRSAAMMPGVKFLASYNQHNQGAELYEFLGFTDIKHPHSDTPVYNTLKDVYAAYPEAEGRLTKLEDIDKIKGLGYGHNVYMVVRDLDDDSQGGWFYLFNGRWSRGSGAEPLSFFRVEEAKASAAAKHEIKPDSGDPYNFARRVSL